MQYKELCEKVGKPRTIIFFIFTVAFIFVALVVIIRLFLPSNDIPWWVDVCLILAAALPWMFYYYYLPWLFNQKERLGVEETKTDEDRTKVFIATAKDLLNHFLKRLKSEEKKMEALKEKVSKTTNPFLIRRYLKKKSDYEYTLFQVRVLSEFLNAYYRENYNLEYFKKYNDHYVINELFIPSEEEQHHA